MLFIVDLPTNLNGDLMEIQPTNKWWFSGDLPSVKPTVRELENGP